MKNIKKTLTAILLLCLCICFAGCEHPLQPEKTAPFSKLSSEDEILSKLTRAMEFNEYRNEFLVEDVSLIDPNKWMNTIPGIKNINCDYKHIESGYNVTVILSFWDNNALVYAYKNNDDSKLTDSQKQLLAKYKEVLESTKKDTKNPAEWLLNIHDYMVKNITYDNTQQYVFNSYDALINGKAICSGYAEVFKTFADMIGVECIITTGTASGENHMWNMVKLDDDWYHIDVTWDDPIKNPSEDDEEDEIEHAYFNITDSAMIEDHNWEKANYPAANSTKYSYFNIVDIDQLHSQAELDDYVAKKFFGGYHYFELYITGEHNIKSSFEKLIGTYSYSYSAKKRRDYTVYSVSIRY